MPKERVTKRREYLNLFSRLMDEHVKKARNRLPEIEGPERERLEEKLNQKIALQEVTTKNKEFTELLRALHKIDPMAHMSLLQELRIDFPYEMMLAATKFVFNMAKEMKLDEKGLVGMTLEGWPVRLGGRSYYHEEAKVDKEKFRFGDLDVMSFVNLPLQERNLIKNLTMTSDHFEDRIELGKILSRWGKEGYFGFLRNKDGTPATGKEREEVRNNIEAILRHVHEMRKYGMEEKEYINEVRDSGDPSMDERMGGMLKLFYRSIKMPEGKTREEGALELASRMHAENKLSEDAVTLLRYFHNARRMLRETFGILLDPQFIYTGQHDITKQIEEDRAMSNVPLPKYINLYFGNAGPIKEVRAELLEKSMKAFLDKSKMNGFRMGDFYESFYAEEPEPQHRRRVLGATHEPRKRSTDLAYWPKNIKPAQMSMHREMKNVLRKLGFEEKEDGRWFRR